MKLYLAEIPDIFGYGLCVIDTDKHKALNALENAFHRAKENRNYHRSFRDAVEWFGGGVREIEPGKVYNDGFRE